MTLSDKFSLAGMLAIIVAVITLAVGWGLNIYHLVLAAMAWDGTGNLALLALRAIGVFVFPLGGVVGLVA